MLNSTRGKQGSTRRPRRRDNRLLSRKPRKLEVLLPVGDSTEESTEVKERKREPRNLNMPS